MIELFYLDSAKSIRQEYLRLNKELTQHESDLKHIAEVMMKTAKELEDYRDNGIDKETDVEKIKNHIFSKLDFLESESNKLARKINPINEAIEKLKRDEISLYNVIRTKYPDLSDQEIKKQIQEHLVK